MWKGGRRRPGEEGRTGAQGVHTFCDCVQGVIETCVTLKLYSAFPTLVVSRNSYCIDCCSTSPLYHFCTAVT